MVRKASDMVMLLGSRGRARSRSGSRFFDAMANLAGSVFGRSSSLSRRRDEGRRARTAVPVWLAFVAAIACFAGGYLTRGHVALGEVDQGPLNAPGRTPSLIKDFDAQPLANQAFIVAAYPNIEPVVAKAQAKDLSDFLRQHSLRARPFEYKAAKGLLWVVAVYFDSEKERLDMRDKLKQLPADVPDASFVHLRNTEADWPTAWPIR